MSEFVCATESHRWVYGGGEREDFKKPRPVWAAQARLLNKTAMYGNRGRGKGGVSGATPCFGESKARVSETTPYEGGTRQ